MWELNYRERLAKLRMYSQERRRDRYMIIFIWKISMGLVDGYALEFMGEGARRGKECLVAEVVRNSPACVRRARENSLSVKGARMFNLLPAELRNLHSDKVQHFKSHFLKKFLTSQQLQKQEEQRKATICCIKSHWHHKTETTKTNS